MASALARTNNQDLTENEDKTHLMSARQSLNSSPDSTPTNKERPLCLEDIQIHLLDENEKDGGVNSQGTPKKRSNSPAVRRRMAVVQKKKIWYAIVALEWWNQMT